MSVTCPLTARRVLLNLRKGQLNTGDHKVSESTHKVPTSHYHTKHCHAVLDCERVS